jgi:low affinity Fe/Cu permease
MSSLKRPLKARVATWTVGGIFVIFGLGGLVMRAIMKVQTGHGLDTYRTGRLVEFSYIGLLASVGVAIVVLLIALLLRVFGLFDKWRFLREIRRSITKHV